MKDVNFNDRREVMEALFNATGRTADFYVTKINEMRELFHEGMAIGAKATIKGARDMVHMYAHQLRRVRKLEIMLMTHGINVELVK